jgi:hypothetical protein
MKKRCSRSKSCGAGCISNAKSCRLNFPTAINSVLNRASDQVGVVELYQAVVANKKRGGAVKFERIRKELRQELGRNIRAGEDARELKRRLVAEGVIPARGAKQATQEDAGQIFAKAMGQPKNPAPPSNLRWELDQLAAQDQQAPLEPRQLSKSPGARTRTLLPPKRTIGDEDLMDDISRLLKGESPQNISMVADDSARVKIKSQIAQLQSVLGLGAQTRKEIGRDLEGLLNEAHDMRDNLKSQIKRAEKSPRVFELVDRLKKVEAAIKGPTTKATGNVRYAREDARDHDDDMLSRGISRELGNKSYRWEDSYGSGSTLLGRGAYGTVLREPNKGNAIKRGEVGKIEADLIDRLGKADLGPKLLAAQLDGDSQYNPGTKIGRVAMTVVAGSPIGSKEPDKEIGGVKVADAYWIARANLHRMGIAHNDMHIDNVLVDRKGKARFVDMGLAQDSPKAALAEAMGAFMPPSRAQAERGRGAAGQGDWQVRRWKGTGGDILSRLESERYRKNDMGAKKFQAELEEKAPVLMRVLDNKPAVQFAMKRDGFTMNEIATVIDHGIRSPMETYEQGVWAKMSNEQAQKYISILYEGV